MPNPQTELLKGLSAEDEAGVMAIGMAIHASTGKVLFHIGEPADNIFLIQQGRVSLTLPLTVRGVEEDVLVEERLPGETLGWSALIPPHRFTLKAIATAESDLLCFPRVTLLEYFERHSTAGQIVTRNVASVIGHRLGVFQAMWAREMQRAVEHRFS
jgi:CRP-like cAMP-binding protein